VHFNAAKLMITRLHSNAANYDTRGIPGGGPPPHTHAWEEVYVVISGEMDVLVAGNTTRLGPGGIAHVPANMPHGYRTLDHTHFLTIVSQGNASKFFRQVAEEVEMNPADLAGILRVGASHGITFLP